MLLAALQAVHLAGEVAVEGTEDKPEVRRSEALVAGAYCTFFCCIVAVGQC